MHSHKRFNRGLVRQYHKWMIAMHYAKNTKTTYVRSLEHFLLYLGDRSIAAVNHDDIRLFLADESENGATLAAVYRHLGVLRQFYDFLNLGGVVDYVAPRFVRLRAPFQSRLGTLTEEQIRLLFAATRTPRERAMLEFFYSTGCRLSEAVKVKIEDLDFRARQARVRGKFGKTRMVLLSESAARALMIYLGARKSGYVFQPEYHPQQGCLYAADNKWMSRWCFTRKEDRKRIQKHKVIGSTYRMTFEEAKKKHKELITSLRLSLPPRKGPLSNMAIQQSLRKITVRVGLKHVTPHTFRRTFATHLHENGASLEVIRALLGHVWIQTTLRYARIGPDGLSRSFEKHHPMGNRYENSDAKNPLVADPGQKIG